MFTGEDKIADIVNTHPHIKEQLIRRNRVFANLNNPVVFNTVGKYARLKDVARASDESLEELVAFINAQVAGNS